ncbi:LysE family transporter [Campylobacter sp. MOP51]|uniref:LysE family transporter n=1 Tax=Campylobacter canis TaxID=3378588 RepID=UPI003C38C828
MFLVCIICTISDAVLIFARVMGFGHIVYKFSYLKYIARYGGAAFLLFYAIKSFYTAYTMNHALILK